MWWCPRPAGKDTWEQGEKSFPLLGLASGYIAWMILWALSDVKACYIVIQGQFITSFYCLQSQVGPKN